MGYIKDEGLYTAPLLNGCDDSSRALEVILGAWSQGDSHEIPREQMAYAALFTAMSYLVSHMGEDAVAKMARGLERRVQVGEFSKNSTRQ